MKLPTLTLVDASVKVGRMVLKLFPMKKCGNSWSGMRKYKLEFDCDLKKLLSKIPKYNGILLGKKMTSLEDDPRSKGSIDIM